MNKKKGGPQISLLGRCGRKKTQFSSSTIASDPCACTYKQRINRKFKVGEGKGIQMAKIDNPVCRKQQLYYIQVFFIVSFQNFPIPEAVRLKLSIRINSMIHSNDCSTILDLQPYQFALCPFSFFFFFFGRVASCP